MRRKHALANKVKRLVTSVLDTEFSGAVHDERMISLITYGILHNPELLEEAEMWTAEAEEKLWIN